MRITLNPDKEYANEVLAKVRANDGYCPCRVEKTDDTRCMCKQFREQSDGECHCGLYIKVND